MKEMVADMGRNTVVQRLIFVLIYVKTSISMYGRCYHSNSSNCKIPKRDSGSQGAEYADGCPLRCCAVWSGEILPTFQRFLLQLVTS
jgi:hypothetical protein